MTLDVDALAQEIRRVDGKHSLGAGQLAEALMPFLASLSGGTPGKDIAALKELVDLVAEETMGESTQDDADEDCVGWSDAGPLPMTFGHVRRAQKAIAALLRATAPAEAAPVGVALPDDKIDAAIREWMNGDDRSADGFRVRMRAAIDAALSPAKADTNAIEADIAEFMRRLGPRWFLEQNWFPASQQAHLGGDPT